MGSHTFVFAGLVIALRAKYKKRLDREKQRRTEVFSTTISTSNETIERGEPNTSSLDVKSLSSRAEENESLKEAVMREEPINEAGYKPRPSLIRALVKPLRPSSVVGPRNFTYYESTEEELETRYQAFSILSWIVPVYIFLVQLCGCIALGWFISTRQLSVPAVNQINAWWSGIFLCISAFNNSGMSLIDANMSPFQFTYFVLFAMSALILLGNTLFPILLRIIIRCLAKIIPNGDRWLGWRNGLKFLIDEKSRILCPYLFTRSELFWLAGTILVFNGINWAAFGVSSAENPAFKNFPVQARVIDGLFQAFAVRSGGFSVVDISSLRIGVQATYVLMMYISSFPISPDNVWEFGMPEVINSEESGKTSEGPMIYRSRKLIFLKRQIKKTFSLDDFWILSAFVWLISVIESQHFNVDPASYSIFNIVFEVVSAYSCVGVSIGHPDYTTSFSGALRGGSQLLLCGVMLLGRTREARKGVMKGDWGVGGSFPGMEDEEDE